MTDTEPEHPEPRFSFHPWVLCGAYLTVLLVARILGLHDSTTLISIVLIMLVIGAAIGGLVSGVQGLLQMVGWWLAMTVCLVVAFMLLMPLMIKS